MIDVARTALGMSGDLAALSTTDAAPYVDLGFIRPPTSDLIRRVNGRLMATDNGVLGPCPSPPPDPTHTWMRWALWTSAAGRRRGAFEIDAPDGYPRLPRVQVYVEVTKVFSSAQHQRMVDDVLDALGGGVWESATVPGVHAEQRFGTPDTAVLLRDIEGEWRAAESARRSLVSELAPARPSAYGLSGLPDVDATTDLPENRILAWWAARRSQQLAHARSVTRGERQRLESFLPTAAPSRAEHLRPDIASVAAVEAQLTTWLQRVRRYVVSTDRIPETVGLGITRDPRRRRLLEALRSKLDLAQTASLARLSALRERATSALFEIWGCVALVRALEIQGWRLRSAPSATGLGAVSLQRRTWWLEHGGDVLEITYEPHIDQPALATDAPAARRHRLQRAIAGVGGADLICVGKSPSPDYVIVLRTPDGAAMTVGDASASDLAYLRAHEADTGKLREKVKKIAYDYGHFIGLRTPDGLIRCSTAASFLLVPGDRAAWASFDKIADTIDQHGIGLIAALPTDPVDGPSISSDDVTSIVATLRAHARDRSHWLPFHAGDVHPAAPS